MKGKLQFEDDITCSVCLNTAGNTLLFDVNDYKVYECSFCSHQFLSEDSESKSSIYEDSYFEGYLCGRLNIYDWVKPIGNLHKASFREIWNGEEKRRQAKQVADSEFCLKHCPECRMTKYNLTLSRIGNLKTKNFN